MHTSKSMSAVSLIVLAMGLLTDVPVGSAETFFRGTPHPFLYMAPAGTQPSGGGQSENLPLKSTIEPRHSFGYGENWSVVFGATGGKAPYVVSLTSPEFLPSGIAFAGNVLSGRTSGGVFGPFEATVVDSAGVSIAARIESISVAGPASNVSLNASSASYRFSKGSNWSVPYVAAGGAAPYSYSIPPALTAVTDTISGVVVSGAGVAGVYTIPALGITDVVGSTGTSNQVVVTVGNDASLSATYSGTLDDFTVTPASAPPKAFVVRNGGDLPSASTSVGTTTGQFQVLSSDCAGPLAGGASCSINVKGLATSSGPLSGTLSISGVASPFVLSGTASGMEPVLSFSGTGAATVASTCTNLTLTNTGGVAGGGSEVVSFTGENASAFQVCAPTGIACSSSTLQPNGSCNIGVRATATAPSSYTATVIATSGNISASIDVSATISDAACATATSVGSYCKIGQNLNVKIANNVYMPACDVGSVWDEATRVCSESKSNLNFASMNASCSNSGYRMPDQYEINTIINKGGGSPIPSIKNSFSTSYYWTYTDSTGANKIVKNMSGTQSTRHATNGVGPARCLLVYIT
jgi:hypothetical protein